MVTYRTQLITKASAQTAEINSSSQSDYKMNGDRDMKAIDAHADLMTSIQGGNRMTPRWIVERKYSNSNHEVLQVIEVYAEGENKELVKSENKQWTYKKKLLLVEG